MKTESSRLPIADLPCTITHILVNWQPDPGFAIQPTFEITRKSKIKNRKFHSFLLLLFISVRSHVAFGQYYSESLLIGNYCLLAAPFANFRAELDRLEPRPVIFKANPPTGSYSQQTRDGDLADLRQALCKTGLTADDADSIVRQYRTAQSALEVEAGKVMAWEEERNSPYASYTRRPVISARAGIAGLPQEFSDYWRASVAWRGGRTNDARILWRNLLGRPAGERPFKSTWAAYLLGKSWELEDPAESIQYYREVRKLAASGFVDTIGLAAASIGREARLCLQQGQYCEAIELYLDQLATGDSSAHTSLRFTAAKALADPHAHLDKLAANPRCRRVITAYLVAGFHLDPVDSDGPFREALIDFASERDCLAKKAQAWHQAKDPAVLWLEAVDHARVRDVEAAGQFALLAYQSGKMDVAARWIKRAKSAPLGQWLQAKLAIRDGKLDAAAELLGKVRRQFPLEIRLTNFTASATFLDSLYFDSRSGRGRPMPGEQVLGELGAVHLARNEYLKALDCLLRAGFWTDAAYIAERVLTIDELKAYVDHQWPDQPRDTPDSAPAGATTSDSRVLFRVSSIRGDLRNLLARRLTRSQRGIEALPYFPTDLRPVLHQSLELIRVGRDPALPRWTRAAALWDAAKLACWRGNEMLRTEVESDWAISLRQRNLWGDNYIMERATNGCAVPATPNELRRVREHGPSPAVPFHYDCTAPALAWEAVNLMPDNSDDTARAICLAGIWIKYCDPDTADLFYKSLVHRCRNTAIGAAADRRRWFPELDKYGNLLPPKTSQAAITQLVE